MLSHHDASWLESQRAKHGHGVIKRTRTRLNSGKVCVRWSECISHALEVSPAWSAVNRDVNLNVRTLLNALVADT